MTFKAIPARYLENAFVVFALLMLTGAFNLELQQATGATITRGIGDQSKQAVFAGIVVVVVLLTIRRRVPVFSAALQRPFILLLPALAFVSLVWSDTPRITFLRGGALLAAAFIGMYLSVRYRVDELIRLIAWALGIAAVLSIIAALFFPATGVMSGDHAGEWKGIFLHKGMLGRFMALSALAFFMLIRSLGRWRVVGVVGCALSVSLVVLAHSAGALLGLLSMMTLLPFYFAPRRYYRLLILAFVIAVVAAAILFIAFPASLQAVLGVFGKDLELNGRLKIWGLVIHQIDTRPILGFGYGAFWQGMDSPAGYVLAQLNWTPGHAHNGFLDVLVDLGVVGLSIFVTGLLVVLARAVAAVRRTTTLDRWWHLGLLVLFSVINLGESVVLRPGNLFWILYVATFMSLPAPSLVENGAEQRKRRLGYLSGGPRASTHLNAANDGPRAHMLGVITAFQTLGWEVQTFIVGDRSPGIFTDYKVRQRVSRRFWRLLVVDGMRLVMGVVNCWQARRELRGKVDWIYERFAVLQALGWVFQQDGVPWILETNGLLYYEAKYERRMLVLSGLAKRMETWAYLRCDVLICISETLKALITRELPIPPEKIVVVPCAVDTVMFDPERHTPLRMFDGFTIGYVGSMATWQGLNVLLETLHELASEGLRLSVVAVGNGDNWEAWKALAVSLGLDAQVKFVGQVPWNEVPRYIAGFDVAFSGQLPLQIGEMYMSPIKLYEYMAMAVPAVAADYDDARRLIRDGENGFLFRAGQQADLKRALRQAYEARDTLHEIGCRAREEIVAHHSWTERIAPMIHAIEQKLKPA